MTRTRRRHAPDQTAYVLLDRSLCDACWECLEACRSDVLGKVDVLFHKHAKVRAADLCTGCGRCVKACESGALTRRADAPPPRLSTGAAAPAREPVLP
jgi:2-oxoglutarate ferredoxin oxidoreductase subunit delta